jgi:hypothetical protein
VIRHHGQLSAIPAVGTISGELCGACQEGLVEVVARAGRSGSRHPAAGPDAPAGERLTVTRQRRRLATWP